MMYKKVRNSGQVANETTIKTTGQRYDQLLIILTAFNNEQSTFHIHVIR